MSKQCERTSKQAGGPVFTSGWIFFFQTIVQGANEGGEGSFESRISAKEKENEEHRNETE